MTEKVAVVDGANVAFAETSGQGKPRVSNLVAVCRALEAKGYQPIIIVDASLRHQVDDPQALEELFDEQTAHQAPSDTDADYFVLETADREDAVVISNDEFNTYREEYPWIEERRVPFMIVDGKVVLYEPKLEQGS